MDYTKRIRPTNRPKFHHTTFATIKLDEMVEFYEIVAGLEVVHYSPDQACWMTNDNANHRIAFLKLPGLVAPENKGRTAGLHHTAFEYANPNEWLNHYARLRDLGYEPFVNLDHGMTLSMYYQDPEGNGVEIQVDAFGDWSVSREWMWSSPDFAENPIGVHFEPAKLLAARDEEGLEWDEIRSRCRNGDYEPAVKPEVHLPEAW